MSHGRECRLLNSLMYLVLLLSLCEGGNELSDRSHLWSSVSALPHCGKLAHSSTNLCFFSIFSHILLLMFSTRRRKKNTNLSCYSCVMFSFWSTMSLGWLTAFVSCEVKSYVVDGWQIFLIASRDHQMSLPATHTIRIFCKPADWGWFLSFPCCTFPRFTSQKSVFDDLWWQKMKLNEWNSSWYWKWAVLSL